MKILQENGLFKTISLGEAETLYLDYFNNFLTIDGFASYYGFDEKSASKFIKYFSQLRESTLTMEF